MGITPRDVDIEASISSVTGLEPVDVGWVACCRCCLLTVTWRLLSAGAVVQCVAICVGELEVVADHLPVDGPRFQD